MATRTSGSSRQQTNAKRRVWFRFNSRENAGFGLGRSLLLAVALALASCEGSGAPPEQGASQAGPPSASPPAAAEPIDTLAFGQAFEVVRELDLEENDRAMVVEPMVSSDGSGTLLLAEPMEGQVNVYGTDGSLKAVVGRKGEAPGEFQLPLTAHRAQNGEILIADMLLQRITFHPPGEGGDPEVVPAPIPVVFSVQDLGSGRYLLSGTETDRPARGSCTSGTGLPGALRGASCPSGSRTGSFRPRPPSPRPVRPWRATRYGRYGHFPTRSTSST